MTFTTAPPTGPLPHSDTDCDIAVDEALAGLFTDTAEAVAHVFFNDAIALRAAARMANAAYVAARARTYNPGDAARAAIVALAYEVGACDSSVIFITVCARTGAASVTADIAAHLLAARRDRRDAFAWRCYQEIRNQALLTSRTPGPKSGPKATSDAQ